MYGKILQPTEPLSQGMYPSFFIHSSTDGHLSCFQILAIISSIALNIGVHIFFESIFQVSFYIFPEWNHWVIKQFHFYFYFFFEERPYFLHGLHCSAYPSICKKVPLMSSMSLVWGNFIFFLCYHLAL